MDNRRTTFSIIALIVLLIVVLSGLTWTNYQYSTQNPGGSDFLSRWVGTRAFFMEGQSPYSEEISLEIQNIFYGRPARSTEDKILFVYPIYTMYLVAPFALLEDYQHARAVWMTALEISLVTLVLVSIAICHWKPPIWMIIITLLFSVLWYHSVRPVINGNISVIIALLIGFILFAIYRRNDSLAGFLLAMSTVKPQMVILLIPFVIIWAISRKRWVLVWSFLGSLAILIISGILLLPDWVLQNIRQVYNYPGYTLAGTPGAIFIEWLPGIGSQLGWVLTILLAALLLWEWKAALMNGYKWFLWTACLTLVITNLIGVRTATANYIAMLPALILVFSVWDMRWGLKGRLLIISSMVVIFFGLWWLFINTLNVGEQPIQHPILFFPLPLFLLLGLYWVRFWAIHPPRTMIDDIRFP